MMKRGNLLLEKFVIFFLAIKCAIAFQGLTVSSKSKSAPDSIEKLLVQGIVDEVYPGVAAIAGDETGVLYAGYFGHENYSDISRPIQGDTVFDIASLTKIISTTSAVALMYQHGWINLDTKIIDILGDKFAANGKGEVTVKHCLLHNAGFQPDPQPWYWDTTFPCPNTLKDEVAEDFSCMPNIYQSLMNESLVSKPGEIFVYSDLSFITLQMVVGKTALEKYSQHSSTAKLMLREECLAEDLTNNDGLLYSCHFEAFVRSNIFTHPMPTQTPPNTHSGQQTSPLMPETNYLPSPDVRGRCAPTLDDTGEGSYTHQRLQGLVSDGDCYAMGGLCGHAGVFAPARDVARFLQAYLISSASAEADVFLLNATTIKTFTTIADEAQSSRALGWSTNSDKAKDFGFDHSCGALSAQTFMHTGYTGGCICVDPVNKLWSVILTNRAYNCHGQLCPVGSSEPVKSIFKEFNTLLATGTRLPITNSDH